MSILDDTEEYVKALEPYLDVESVAGEWFRVTQEVVDAFADVTGDHQFIHVDPDRARETPFGGTIAHGFLTLSLVIMLQHSIPAVSVETDRRIRMAVNYGLNRVRFPAPVPVGSNIRATRKLIEASVIEAGCIQQVSQVVIHVEGGSRPSCVAETVGRIYLE